MAKFKPGQRVRIIITSPDLYFVKGQEAIIIKERAPHILGDPKYKNEPWYDIQIPAVSPPPGKLCWCSAESCLEPILGAREWFEQHISIPAPKKQEPIDA